MAKKEEIKIGPGSEITLKQSKSEKPLKIILVVSQTGVFIALVFSTVFSCELLKTTQKNTEVTKKQTETIIEQYENSIKPQLYGGFATKLFYEEYVKNKGFRSVKEKELLKGKQFSVEGGGFFFGVENPTPNIAFKVSVFIGLSNETLEVINRVTIITEDESEVIKSGRLLGSRNAAKYIKPEEYFVFQVNQILEEDIRKHLIQIYEEEDTEEIIKKDVLTNREGETFFAIVYQDIRGVIHINKTKWYYNEEGHPTFKKTKLYDLSKM